MTTHQEFLVDEAIQRCAEIPLDPLVEPFWDYMLCLWVESEMNVVQNQFIPYQEIHQRVNAWIAQ